MRKLATLTAAAALGTFAFGGAVYATNAQEPVTTVDLVAGQNAVVGRCIVEVVEENFRAVPIEHLTVEYSTQGGPWWIAETHLYHDPELNCPDAPQTRSGNPKIGRFPLATEHTTPPGVKSVEETVPGDTQCIAAQAVVVTIITDDEGVRVVDREETAWCEGDPFGGANWAMFLNLRREPGF